MLRLNTLCCPLDSHERAAAMGTSRRTMRKHFRDVREDVWKKPRLNEDGIGAPAADGGWDPFVTKNPDFERYYKRLGIIPENEWDDFITTLRKPLPAVFRINGSGLYAKEISVQIQHEFVENLSMNNEIDKQGDDFIRALTWYPKGLAWQLNFSRMQLRKNQTLSRIHEFLKRETLTGSIARQEAVSMVPPLFLDVHPHHVVLDMCAAPGSKTFQLLEMIHSADERGSLPAGFIVANDLDVQRCHLLIHQTKRMCSPSLIVTNHEAQHFPGLKKDQGCSSVNSLESCTGVNSLSAADEVKHLAFDRVLCDVPCSGDGTMRKAPDLWKKWNVGMGNGLHRLQLQIAMRGLALLKVGGRMVYSTCSLNPVENEAVVGEILRQSNGCVELIDASVELPDLKRRPGLKTWKVKDKGNWYSSYRHVKKHRVGSVIPSMFPAGEAQEQQPEHVDTNQGQCQVMNQGTPQEEEETVHEFVNDDDGEVSELPLERCMRILPHDQDTGGFFIAVLRKISPFKVEKPAIEGLIVMEEKSCVVDKLVVTNQPAIRHEYNDNGEMDSFELKESLKNFDHSVGTKQHESHGLDPQLQVRASRVQKQGTWKGVDPVLLLNDEGIIKSLIDFYGIKETFPLNGRLITRSGDTSRLKRIYYASQSVTDIISLNLRRGNQMKITSVGLKLFERQGGKEGFSPCAFRIASEGLPLLLPHLSKQIVHAGNQDFKLLLLQRVLNFSAFTDQTFSTAVEALLPGCCVVILDDQGSCDSQSVTAIGCWRGRTNLSLLISQEDVEQLLERRFQTLSPLVGEELQGARKGDTPSVPQNDNLIAVNETSIHEAKLDEQESI